MSRGRAVSRDSEFRAYVWINNRLGVLGWDCRHPDRGGQVYTQHECRAHPELKAHLEGGVPENVVMVRHNVSWVIEAKPSHSELDIALGEAKEYAKRINRSSTLTAHFVSGVAGTEGSTFLVESRYWDGKRFAPITVNDRHITSLLSPQLATDILDNASPSVSDVVVEKALFLAAAEEINGILHDGGINLKDRAQVMSALLLALLDDTRPNVDAPPEVLIQEINARTRRVLREQDKESYFPYTELKLPATADNHLVYKTALVKTIQELHNLNIRSAMNSGADVLGEFYEGDYQDELNITISTI